MPSPTPTQQPRPQATPTGIRALISKAFADDPETAQAVAMGESSLNPQARLRTTVINKRTGGIIPVDAIGLMQINLPAHLDKVPGKTYEEKAQNLMDPEINLQVAKKIYATQGWQPWEAFTNGAYQKYKGN